MSLKNTHRYDDIIHLPHHSSDAHPRMPLSDRAAQFSPFAALTGHGAAIRETERLTDLQQLLAEDAALAIDRKLRFLQEKLAEQPLVAVTYFLPDLRKEGGSYQTVRGTVRRLDPHRRLLVMEDSTQIPLDDITDIELL